MPAVFNTIVKDIANKYINNVLFIDEQAFPIKNSTRTPDKQKDLDIAAVSRAFSESGKICGFYAPHKLEDIETCKKLVLKPDIVVLDWDIRLEIHYSKEEESQDDETDDRGHYSLDLLKTIVDEAGEDKLKVVFIYTGETGIEGIVDDIAECFGERFQIIKDSCEVYSENIHILVRLKPESKVSHTDYSKFIVAYEDLPNELVSTFAKYVDGLMTCFAMSSLVAMRDSTAKVLQVYNSELDAELLGHQLALNNPDDAKLYLANSFSTAICELIMDNPEINTDNWVDYWIDSRFSSDEKIVKFVGSNLKVTSSKLKTFFSNRHKDKLKQRINTSFSSNYTANEDKLKIELSKLFHKEGDDIQLSKYRFAALAHHKSIFSNHKTAPSLTQGTIIKDQEGRYYLCIQQRCDTARIKMHGLDFLFLPLHKKKQTPSMGAILLGTNEYYYIHKSSKEVVFIHFSPKQDDRPVIAEHKGSKFLFSNEKGEYEWVNELKDMISQRVVADFASHFARVGVDEAEWLRLEGQEN